MGEDRWLCTLMGLAYAWDINIVISVVLQVFVCVIYAGICLFRNEKWQMQSGKLITFLYAVVMAAVFVGLLERIAKEIIGITSDIGEIVTTTTVKPTIPPGVISSHFPVSFVTLYLGIMCAIFLITTLLHPYDFTCLLNGFTYLLCLPSGYFVLNIYSIVNITDSSWGLVTPDDSGEESDSDIVPEDFDSDKEDTDNEEQKNSDEDSENKQKPPNVEKWLPKGMKKYARVFIKNGFENTYFLGMLTETDLKRLGIKKLAHRINLYQKIRDIPKFTIPVAVPKDPNSWLHSLGLEMYKPNFQRNNIKSAQDMEALKSFTKNDIKEELGIRKAGKLQNLRNECLMISGIVNCLWIVIVMTLSRSIDLRIAGTDPLSLIFLVVFGFILVLQFVCMLIHRFTTLCHFIARAPYRCGQEYRTSISLMSPLSSEERAVQRLLPEVRRLMQNQ
uniref:Ankyrin repeat and SAM domain-containing protein 1A n=1 Tax=Magallana gigas TaxID=29159 RepID=K1QY68_MAGGI